MRRIVRDQRAAEYLAQETYLKTHQAMATRRIEHLEQYIFQTARNLALDNNRHKRFRGQFYMPI